ncbi:capsular polysaccharide transport system permease protein [Humitalea rosea]|uniref:Capsular polysaccharide transport system permease protein n=1 Tax=Humitalea rosea TaxID=990373 RepID=A0A2W7I4S8_9PROT|nr:capsule biosynthesis protein [Humitalea rosea]PZW41891.1 capsular polysaccharide transport system permease protein [Humitalea rosea]
MTSMKLSTPIRLSDANLSVGEPHGTAPRRPPALARFWRRRKGLILCVLLPLTVASLYFYGFAAPQYASESKFQVRGRTGSSSFGSGGAAGLASLMGGSGISTMPQEGLAVRDFLTSLDAVVKLRAEHGLVDIYRRPEADVVAGLWSEEPSAEKLQRYFNSMVTVTADQTTGITSIQVRAFRPDDARTLNEALLGMAESLINRLSARVRDDTLQVARREVAVAEQRIADAGEALLAFRETERALNPAATAEAALRSVATLEQTLLQTRAELEEKSAYMRRDNPLIATLRNRIAALQTGIAEERRRTTSGGQALPQQIAGYERLQLEREFADRQLASATASLEQARVEASRQQLFLARVVEPNLAEYAMYPRAGFILASMAAVLVVLYAIGWLIVAGMREHAS